MQRYKIESMKDGKNDKMIEEMKANRNQPEVELGDQGGRETVVEEELVAS